jgi:peptide deformylase
MKKIKSDTAMFKILTYPHPDLRKKAADVDTADDVLRKIVDDMADAMYSDDGVGLAATQVGISKRIVVIDGGKGFLALFNPEIVDSGEETETMEEGCLSLPGIRVQITRPTHVTVRAINDQGETTQWDVEGLMARIFQHEIDHLNGILIIDRISSIQRSLMQSKLRKLEKEALRS